MTRVLNGLSLVRWVGLFALVGLSVSHPARAQYIVQNGVPIGAQTNQITGTTINVPEDGDIQAAVEKAFEAGGGTVVLAAGTYNLTQGIIVPSNTTIEGQGSSTVILGPKTPNGLGLISAPLGGVSNIIIKNLVLDGNIPRGAFLSTGGAVANLYGGAGLYFYGNNSGISNIEIQNVEIRNAGIGILATVTNGITFNNVYIHDNNPGNFSHNAYLVGCDFVYVTHSRFMDAHTGDGLHFDFSASYYFISKSEFSGNNGEGILDQGSTNINIQDSIFSGNSNDGLNASSSNDLLTRNYASYDGGYGFNIQGGEDSTDLYGVGDGGGIGFFNYGAGAFSNLLASTTANQYLAILAQGVVGATDTADWTTALSGTTTIGAVDFNANHLSDGKLVFPNVSVATAGSYPIAIRYANGAATANSLILHVNGKSFGRITFPSTGSNSTWSTVNLTIPLTEGANNLTLLVPALATSAPELDNITVATSVPAAPAAPAGLTAKAIDPYHVDLSWQAVPGAGNYVVVRNGRVINAAVLGTTFSDTEILLGDSTVNYSVFAVNQGGSGASSSVTVTTPLDAPAGLQLSQGSSGVQLSWMSANGATSYNVKRSTNLFGPYTTIASVPNTTNLSSSNFIQTYTDSTGTANAAYYYAVSAVGTSQSSNSYELGVGLTGALKSTSDIGVTKDPGLTEFIAANSTYGLAGAGTGFAGPADRFHYAWVPINGDVTMTARVTYLQALSPSSQAGIDLRESLDPHAAHALAALTGSLGAIELARTATNGATSVTGRKTGIKPTYWIRLNRKGDVFTASVAADGIHWTIIGQATIKMHERSFIGLGVSSTIPGTTATALFDHVRVSGGI